MNIYVGNISHSSTEEGLKSLFSQFGIVTSVKVIKDKFTGASRGFAFVDMSSAEEAKRAIDELNGCEFDGRSLKVNEARPVEQREHRGAGDRGHRPQRSGGFQPRSDRSRSRF